MQPNAQARGSIDGTPAKAGHGTGPVAVSTAVQHTELLRSLNGQHKKDPQPPVTPAVPIFPGRPIAGTRPGRRPSRNGTLPGLAKPGWGVGPGGPGPRRARNLGPPSGYPVGFAHSRFYPCGFGSLARYSPRKSVSPFDRQRAYQLCNGYGKLAVTLEHAARPCRCWDRLPGRRAGWRPSLR